MEGIAQELLLWWDGTVRPELFRASLSLALFIPLIFLFSLLVSYIMRWGRRFR